MKAFRDLVAVSLASILFMGVCSVASAQNWEKKYDGVELAYYDNEIYVVRIDTDLIGVSIFPTVSQAHEPSTTKAWCEKHELEIGVNANFYNMNTQQNPLGMTVYQGVNWGEKNTNQFAQIAFTKDNRVKIYPAANTDQPAWMYYAVAGEPEIVKDGKVIDGINSTKACTSLGHCKSNRSRTGACLDKNGKHLLLMTTKGDNSNGGITVVRFAEYMVALGCDYGVNLDGGGSAQIYLAGNKYGTNGSRKVASSLGFNVIDTPSYICKVAEIDNPGTVFYDMAADHWALSAAEALKTHEITAGCGGEAGRPLFCPSCGTQRIQAAAFVFKALGLEASVSGSPTFQDIPATHKYYGEVEALVAKGILSKGDNFRPDDVMTRAEAAAILAKAFVANSDDYANAPTPTFSDVPQDKWYYASVEALARNCMISGSGGEFKPANPISRAEFAVMLAAAAGYVTAECVFEKKCDKLGEAVCDGDNLSTCVAFERVLSSCENGKKCIAGVCAECSSDEKPSCDAQKRKYCEAGSWKTEDCASKDMICSGGKCIAEDKKECESDFEPVCDEDGWVKVCSDGRFVYESCYRNQVCKNGKCQDAASSDGNGDGGSGDGSSDDTSIKPGVNAHADSSCAINAKQHQSLPWGFLMLFGGLALMRRRRSNR